MSDSPRIVVSLPSDELAADVGDLPEGVETVVWDLRSPAPRDAFDMVVPPYMSGRRILAALDGVRVGLLQSQSIGYEGLAGYVPDGARLANASSVHETATAELAVGLAIAAQRNLADYVRDQEARRWAPLFGASVADSTVLVLGYGGVGKAIAARLRPFETDIVPVASRARDEDGEHIHGIDELAELLKTTDILMIALPGGEGTRGLIGAEQLALLPDGALVVNVGRGSIVDTDALVAELQRERLRAALDVVDPEPLPEDHPLWHAPGALIVPHVGGASEAMRPRIARLVREQIERLAAGEEPRNVVTP
ncbi:2-hydroxyacid dehydrogenase [Microbacterium radiodurans]|uniref:2-hydroxyacid dehydrogenase n=1 Tax=Microbacterium radiodurans TaxID=661398 RepID=A0A5J5IX32_9MICO|nr:2-hydroxyacid dehydrogenase [Microbacterium radiodurans]KAA9089362.1 2-hydroxyacid dehydrogenase [Microbacterium radiodurans]